MGYSAFVLRLITPTIIVGHGPRIDSLRAPEEAYRASTIWKLSHLTPVCRRGPVEIHSDVFSQLSYAIGNSV